MKKYFLGIITGFIACTMLVSTMAIANSPIKLIVNGVEVVSDVPPQIIDGRTMVPARPLAEALGADVRWDEANYAVVVTGGVQAGAVPTDLEPVGDKIRESGGDAKMWEINGVETKRVITNDFGAYYILMGNLRHIDGLQVSYSDSVDSIFVGDDKKYDVVNFVSSTNHPAVKKDDAIYVSLQALQDDGILAYQVDVEQRQIAIMKRE